MIWYLLQICFVLFYWLILKGWKARRGYTCFQLSLVWHTKQKSCLKTREVRFRFEKSQSQLNQRIYSTRSRRFGRTSFGLWKLSWCIKSVFSGTWLLYLKQTYCGYVSQCYQGRSLFLFLSWNQVWSMTNFEDWSSSWPVLLGARALIENKASENAFFTDIFILFVRHPSD